MSTRSAQNDIHEQLRYEARTVAVPVLIQPSTLALLAQHDQAEAARQLAWLQPGELEAVAFAYAAWLNSQDDHGDDVTAAQILALFHRCIAKHGYTPLEASTPALAAVDHTTPEDTSMIAVTFEPDATITTLTLDPSLIVALRLLLETQHPEPQFHRGLNGDGKRPGALRRLLDGTPFVFNPVTHLLTIASASEPGNWQETDGASCSCKGAAHAWCWHRAAWHCIVLALALTDPHGLLATPTFAPVEQELAFAA